MARLARARAGHARLARPGARPGRAHPPAPREGAWLAERRSDLLERLAGLEAPDRAGATLAALAARLDLVDELERATLEAAAPAWDAAAAAVAVSPRYDGLVLRPQRGLVPLAPDPTTGLWEFLVHGTGAAPERDGAGRLRVTEATGIVLVLLPGGEATIGAWSEEDPDVASLLEGPRHRRRLAPFFLAKHELTRAQWERLELLGTGRPASLDEGGALPQGGLPWAEARARLARLGLELPTSTQWEYAARAGSAGPFCVDRAELVRHANLLDRRGVAQRVVVRRLADDWDDGFAGSAPVGSFEPNAFGLPDVHGNLWEWCGDLAESYHDPLTLALLRGVVLRRAPLAAGQPAGRPGQPHHRRAGRPSPALRSARNS